MGFLNKKNYTVSMSGLSWVLVALIVVLAGWGMLKSKGGSGMKGAQQTMAPRMTEPPAVMQRTPQVMHPQEVLQERPRMAQRPSPHQQAMPVMINECRHPAGAGENERKFLEDLDMNNDCVIDLEEFKSVFPTGTSDATVRAAIGQMKGGQGGGDSMTFEDFYRMQAPQ